MKILALYSMRTLSLVRRVLAPFSVLSTRGHSFAFLQVPSFDAAYAGNYDITVLPNWILSALELANLQEHVQQNQTCFAYDLADPQLLQIASVLETLRCCTLITVPNEYLAKEVKIAVPGKRVIVLPSTVDIPYMMTGTPARPGQELTVGCFGPFDWTLVADALGQCREQQRHITFVGDAYAQRTLGTLVSLVDVTTESYPSLVRQCHYGLMPLEQRDGRDLIWQQEYGIVGKPVLCLPPAHAKQPEKWMEAIKSYAYDGQKRQHDGQLAQEEAKTHSAVRLADQYLRRYQQMLPQVQAIRYT